jgi:hypothetical protein
MEIKHPVTSPSANKAQKRLIPAHLIAPQVEIALTRNKH